MLYMVNFDKKVFYVVNIITVIYALVIIFISINSTSIIYKEVVKKNQNIEKEYNKALEQYKKVIVFILNNNLIKNLNYFNAFVDMTCDLPFAKKLEIVKANNIAISVHGNSKTTKDKIFTGIIGCYSGECIKIFVNKRDVLIKISKETLGVHDKDLIVPLNKFSLLITSINAMLETHKNFLFLNLLYFLILYLFQSPLMIIKNIRLNEAYNSLSNITTKTQNDLNKMTNEQGYFYDSILCLQGLIDNYFTYYAHQLITMDVYVESVDIITILHKVERFFKYQIYKKDLKFILDSLYPSCIARSDKEIIFILLLNFIFKAIYRASVSSKISIKITKIKNIINIKIDDNGYEYKQKTSEKIQIFELPAPFFKKLCQKIQLEFKEVRKGERGTVFIKLKTEFEVEEFENKNKPGNVIKLKIYDKKN